MLSPSNREGQAVCPPKHVSLSPTLALSPLPGRGLSGAQNLCLSSDPALGPLCALLPSVCPSATSFLLNLSSRRLWLHMLYVSPVSPVGTIPLAPPPRVQETACARLPNAQLCLCGWLLDSSRVPSLRSAWRCLGHGGNPEAQDVGGPFLGELALVPFASAGASVSTDMRRVFPGPHSHTEEQIQGPETPDTVTGESQSEGSGFKSRSCQQPQQVLTGCASLAPVLKVIVAAAGRRWLAGQEATARKRHKDTWTHAPRLSPAERCLCRAGIQVPLCKVQTPWLCPPHLLPHLCPGTSGARSLSTRVLGEALTTRTQDMSGHVLFTKVEIKDLIL